MNGVSPNCLSTRQMEAAITSSSLRKSHKRAQDPIAMAPLLAQESAKTRGYSRLASKLALPNDQHLPAINLQLRNTGRIARSITADFCAPVLGIFLRQSAATRTIMSVPETPVHKYDLPACRERHIRFPREIATMQAVAVSHTVSQAPHGHFRGGVFSLDGAHYAAALFRRCSRNYFTSIFKLGSVSNSSTISLYRLTTSRTAVCLPVAANLPNS